MDNGVLLTAAASLISALVGGGVWSVASTWLQTRSQGEESEKERLHADLRRAIASHVACEEKLVTIERRLEAVEHHHASMVPRWIKDAKKRLLWVNGAAMVMIFGPLGLTRDQVEGRTFADLLGMEVVREIERLDRAALVYPGRAVSSFLQLHPQLPAMTVVKIAGISREGDLIFEGLAYCANDPEDDADQGARRGKEQLGLSSLRMQRSNDGENEAGRGPAGIEGA
ncbi:MAG: hypothetical protein QOH86_1237 [Sphingomonadales bacterium]|jgi:hypothetical protein|nr:hypothetical protein [Sphingomonadales bacterium]